MPRVAEIVEFLKEMAPPELAEDWDNIGLLIGDPEQDVSSIMTCLTLSPDVAEEAVRRSAHLIVTHHPILFRSVQRVTAETQEGRMLLQLIESRIAVYSPHTAYDSAAEGINQQWAERLRLTGIEPLRPQMSLEDTAWQTSESATSGAGRCGTLPTPLSLQKLVQQIKETCHLEHLQYAGDPERPVERVGIACGSAAGFLPDAQERGCQVLITGEAKFHNALEARTLGMGLILTGHYASERPAMEHLAEVLRRKFPDLTTWASEQETDPILWA